MIDPEDIKAARAILRCAVEGSDYAYDGEDEVQITVVEWTALDRLVEFEKAWALYDECDVSDGSCLHEAVLARLITEALPNGQ